jgi:predicted nucleic acid-binding protein
LSTFVAADASPLIGLATADALELLRELFGSVTITKLVKDEVVGRGDLRGARELRDAMRAGWIKVAPTPLETWHLPLDAGEASTIALARRHANPLVLMDDALGRERAAALGLEVAGVAELLAMAKRAGLIDQVRPIVERLARRGFTIPEDLLRGALEAAGERSPPPGREPA